VTIAIEARRSVFIRGLNWVGDAIIATPTLSAIRRAFAGSQIVLMVRPWVAAVYENNPDIDELWVHDDSASIAEFRKAVKRVKAARFDLGIALPNSIRSAALMRLGGIKNRVGYSIGGRSLLLNRGVALDKGLLEGHQVFYYLNIIRNIMEMPKDKPALTLIPGQKERARITQLEQERGWDQSRTWIGMAPGSINSLAKRWLPERFAETADRLYEETGALVFLLGSKAEADVVGQVASLCKNPVVNLGTELNLAEFIAFMDRMHAFVGNDSGAMHVAAALGVPTAAIFGPTDWRTTSPYSPVARIIRHPVECSPCMLRNCPIEHPCMKGVSVNQVLETINSLSAEIQSRRLKPDVVAAGVPGSHVEF